MQQKKEFVNRRSLEFVEIGVYDEEELHKCGLMPNKNVAVELDALECLRFFPNIENLILRPGEIRPEGLMYLSDLPIVSLRIDYYADCIDAYTISLRHFPRLQYLFSRTQFGFSDLSACLSLQTLAVQEWSGNNLINLQSENLLALKILSGRLHSLNGLQNIPLLRSLSISNQRELSDVQELAHCNGLESLSFERCGRVNTADIPPLSELQYLALVGTRRVENLSFLKRFPRLENVMLGIEISDGDLQKLFKMKNVAILQDRRNYSAKHRDLPKSPPFHSAYIPAWLEILPEAL